MWDKAGYSAVAGDTLHLPGLKRLSHPHYIMAGNCPKGKEGFVKACSLWIFEDGMRIIETLWKCRKKRT